MERVPTVKTWELSDKELDLLSSGIDGGERIYSLAQKLFAPVANALPYSEITFLFTDPEKLSNFVVYGNGDYRRSLLYLYGVPPAERGACSDSRERVVAVTGTITGNTGRTPDEYTEALVCELGHLAVDSGTSLCYSFPPLEGKRLPDGSYAELVRGFQRCARFSADEEGRQTNSFVFDAGELFEGLLASVVFPGYSDRMIYKISDIAAVLSPVGRQEDSEEARSAFPVARNNLVGTLGNCYFDSFVRHTARHLAAHYAAGVWEAAVAENQGKPPAPEQFAKTHENLLRSTGSSKLLYDYVLPARATTIRPFSSQPK
jgi:hypothetical protein